MRYRLLAVVVVLLGSSLPAAALAGRSANVSTLKATLRGSAEVGKKGAPRGSGSAVIKLYRSQGKACWTLSVKNLDKTLSAHVHKAPKGKTGPVVIPLGARFAKKGCVTGLTAKTIDAIVKNPGSYYVNVHTKKYIDGAIRGQLHR
jgi:hypothetical protein